MKYMSSILALATLAAILPAQAQQRPHQEGQAPASTVPLAVGDPLKVIYRISGVTDSNSADNTGVATSFHCTNFGAVTEKVRFVIKHFTGTVLANVSNSIFAGRTFSASTHNTNIFNEDIGLATGGVDQGSAIISATAPEKIHCSAMVVDAAASTPQEISLHMVRFNPAAGTQE